MRSSALIIVLVSLNLVATPTADAAGPLAPASPDELSVLQQTVDIDYGNKISITTMVDSGPGSVDSVRALFRPRGGSTVWSYYYPEFVVEGERISVTFEISTGPGSYYPPGTEFEIEIEVTHAGGDVSVARSPEMIEYLDPARNWQRTDGDGYSIVYYGVSASDVNSLIDSVNTRIPGLREVLGIPEAPDFPDFKAVVFPSLRDATPSFPPVSQTATDQFLFAGFAQPQYRLFVQGQMNPTTFVHELAHLYTHEAVSSSLQTGLPSWLGEGLARFLETGSSSSSNTRLRSSVRPDELLSLRHMGTIPGRRSDVFIFYPQAGAFVGYLVEEYGAGSMADYLAVMNGGQPLLQAFEQIYGQTLYEVENDWRSRFGAGPLALPAATPEPTRSADGSSPGTPVPLVDFSAGMSNSTGAAGDAAATSLTGAAAPVFLPTATPRPVLVIGGGSGNSGTSDSGSAPEAGDGSGPDYVVGGLIAVLLIVVAAWLFTSRRSKLPKRETGL
ncbi:MAG: peptidase MA family metallohydrolase [Chloroflexi bacterium]|nr:peptidase MA family metallohydrolase [Chloroflexota bacterium]